MKLQGQLASFNGDLISDTLERLFSKDNPHFLRKISFKTFILGISQGRPVLHGLGEEICQKMCVCLILGQHHLLPFCLEGLFLIIAKISPV